ncbi:MAG: hypothetical protein ABIH49_00660 [archaeon]
MDIVIKPQYDILDTIKDAYATFSDVVMSYAIGLQMAAQDVKNVVKPVGLALILVSSFAFGGCPSGNSVDYQRSQVRQEEQGPNRVNIPSTYQLPITDGIGGDSCSGCLPPARK